MPRDRKPAGKQALEQRRTPSALSSPPHGVTIACRRPSTPPCRSTQPSAAMARRRRRTAVAAGYVCRLAGSASRQPAGQLYLAEGARRPSSSSTLTDLAGVELPLGYGRDQQRQ